MVKKLFLLLMCSLALTANDIVALEGDIESVVVKDDPLTEKIKEFVSQSKYEQNRAFINAVFDPKSAFYKNDRVDAVKVIQTLKENGLLDLFFDKPQEFRLNFKTNVSPIFFVKIMSDTLNALGYFKYVTIASTRDASEFVWSVNITSEYATDPLILQQELQKKSCEIVDIQRNSAKEWSYLIDISKARLNVTTLQNGKNLTLKRFLYEHWLDVSKIKSLTIRSSSRNHWYPYIAYYDSSLHLLKVIKKESIHQTIELEIPKNSVYMKISDLYTLKNLKDELLFYPEGSR